MITAEEARKQSEEYIKNHATLELQTIENGIIEEVHKGYTKYAYEGYISEPAFKELERCGFKVDIGSQYNVGYVVIKW